MPQQYTVLARKWRPQQFDEVVGQEHVTQTLQNAIKKHRLAHAYLFVGPRGIGKTSTARIFAKALNCVKGPTVTPCDKCDNCKEIAEGRSFDVLEFDAASNTQVDKIREIIIDTVKYTPAKGRHKIYLVDEVHMLSDSSFNALLKTLEEPPSHVIFFFATTDPQKVPLTILSRCQRFDLRRIPAAAMLKHLKQIAKAEKVSIDEKALLAITRGAEGSLRDAESALDQLIAFCGNEIAEDDVLGVFGLVAHDLVAKLADAVIDGKTQDALQVVHQLVEAGKDLQRLHGDLLAHFRNLLILIVSPEANLDVSDVEMDLLKKQAARLDADAALRIMDTLAAAESRLRYALSKQIVLEVILLQAIQARHAVSVDSLLKKLNELKTSIGGGKGGGTAAAERRSVGAVERETASESEAPVEEETQPARGRGTHRSVSDVAAVWQEVLEHASKVRPFIRSYLLEARPIGIENNVLTVAFDPEFEAHKEFVDTPQNIQVLQTKLKQLLQQDVGVRLIVMADDTPMTRAASKPTAVTATAETPPQNTPAEDEAPASRPAVSPSPKNKNRAEELRKDPLIQKALEIFRGSIVDARG
jgi:DNA polymerase-3 subunit gamma/tau